MAMNNCEHAYAHKLAPDLLVCDDCGELIRKAQGAKHSGEIVLPPRIYEITPALWRDIRPWPLMPFELVKKYEWYVSYLFGHQYLVMPVLRKGKPVFYSARILRGHDNTDKNNLPKYTGPKDTEKVYWKSQEYLGDPVFISEGIADATYLSQLGSSVALLGSYYDGSLNKDLEARRPIPIMDGDAKGIEATFRIVEAFKKHGCVRVNAVILPPKKDPTDLPILALRRLIQKQTGVKL